MGRPLHIFRHVLPGLDALLLRARGHVGRHRRHGQHE